MKVVAFTGRSGSGKTTAVSALITHYVARGLRVGAIKHTHHPLNSEDRGDTAKFRRAGANPVLLAGGHEAVIFDGIETRRTTFDDPRELLRVLDVDLVLAEGFKLLDIWPRIEFKAGEWWSLPDLIAEVDRIGAP